MIFMRSDVDHATCKRYKYAGPLTWTDETAFGNGLWTAYDAGSPSTLNDLHTGLIHYANSGYVLIPGSPAHPLTKGAKTKKCSTVFVDSPNNWVAMDLDKVNLNAPAESLEEARNWILGGGPSVAKWIADNLFRVLSIPDAFSSAGFIFHPSSKCFLLDTKIRGHIYFMLDAPVWVSLWPQILKSACIDKKIYGPAHHLWLAPATFNAAPQYLPWEGGVSPRVYIKHQGGVVVTSEEWREKPAPKPPLTVMPREGMIANSPAVAAMIFDCTHLPTILQALEGTLHDTMLSTAGKLKSAIIRGDLTSNEWHAWETAWRQRGVTEKETSRVREYCENR